MIVVEWLFVYVGDQWVICSIYILLYIIIIYYYIFYLYYSFFNLDVGDVVVMSSTAKHFRFR